MLRHTTSSIEQLIGFRGIHLELGTVHFSQPGALGIVILVFLILLALVHRRGTEAFLRHVDHTKLTRIRDHILIKFQIVNPRVTPHEPSLTIIIDHHRRIDMIPRAVLEQRFSNGITEGARGRITHCHTDGHTSGQAGMGTDIPIELTVALNCLRGPGTIICP